MSSLHVIAVGDSKFFYPMISQVAGSYTDLHSWDNLYLAYRKAAKGKRGRAAAAAFEYKLEDNLIQLEKELANETYCPGAYTQFTIHEPKQRLISAADFRDRVVHHALVNIIGLDIYRRGLLPTRAMLALGGCSASSVKQDIRATDRAGADPSLLVFV